ncbi:hypothetical protein BFF98_08420 [Corynebacterium pseudotuberculosis]|nr:hypothetical protein BFF98_08420 [Corynebacterium pseudotuberculosis]
MRITKTAHLQLHPRYSHQIEGKSLKIPPHTSTLFGGKTTQNIHRTLQILARAAVLSRNTARNTKHKAEAPIEPSRPLEPLATDAPPPKQLSHPSQYPNPQRSDI